MCTVVRITVTEVVRKIESIPSNGVLYWFTWKQTKEQHSISIPLQSFTSNILKYVLFISVQAAFYVPKMLNLANEQKLWMWAYFRCTLFLQKAQLKCNLTNGFAQDCMQGVSPDPKTSWFKMSWFRVLKNGIYAKVDTPGSEWQRLGLGQFW